MDFFQYRAGQLFAEDVSVNTIAQQYDTPCYVYSRATIERHWKAFNYAFGDHPHTICYAVKANSSIAILNILAKMGSGFDIVSIGELERVMKAGGMPDKVVFSGVGKRKDEIYKALQLGIRCFNVESPAELYRINAIAKQLDMIAPISLRVNPDVDAQTHPYISTGLKENKFGIDISEAKKYYLEAQTLSHLNIMGIDCHIGSQLTTVTPFIDAVDRLLLLLDELAAHDIKLHHIDVGGGLGICYQDERPPEPVEYATAILNKLSHLNVEIMIEPGRAIVGNAGILVTRVEYIKRGDHKNFAIVDAAMNDLMRPALYSAWQSIIPVEIRTDETVECLYDVVGPICETGDFLGKARNLKIQDDDLLAVRSSGAYGFTMSSNYNSRPRPPEIFIDKDKVHLIRERETIEQLMLGEHIVD